MIVGPLEDQILRWLVIFITAREGGGSLFKYVPACRFYLSDPYRVR